MNKYLLYFGVVLFLLIFKLVWDWYAKNKRKRIIDHFQSMLIDGAIYFALSWILFHDLRITIALLLISGGVRWLLFDLFFNLLNKDNWNHLGRSSKLDIFLRKYKNYQILIKLIPIAIGIIILILWI